jgi:NADPH-dependent curcumin reductase CurA
MSRPRVQPRSRRPASRRTHDGQESWQSLIERRAARFDPNLDIPLSAYLGVLGMTGITAYFGLLDVGGFEPGQTVVVSGAAGAVGSTVGQIAKANGGRAIGIAGGEHKCRCLVERLGIDAAIDHKTESVRKSLRQHAPHGVDVFFDNVGGPILDDVLTRLAHHARVVICAAVSQYNSEVGPQGPKNYHRRPIHLARCRQDRQSC